MRSLMMALWSLTLTGCVSVSAGVGTMTTMPVDAEGAPLQKGITVRVTDDKVVAMAVPDTGAPQVADYIIQRSDDPTYLYHLEAVNPGDAFRVELMRARFYKGKFNIKVYMDKAATPAATESFNIP